MIQPRNGFVRVLKTLNLSLWFCQFVNFQRLDEKEHQEWNNPPAVWDPRSSLRPNSTLVFHLLQESSRKMDERVGLLVNSPDEDSRKWKIALGLAALIAVVGIAVSIGLGVQLNTIRSFSNPSYDVWLQTRTSPLSTQPAVYFSLFPKFPTLSLPISLLSRQVSFFLHK